MLILFNLFNEQERGFAVVTMRCRKGAVASMEEGTQKVVIGDALVNKTREAWLIADTVTQTSEVIRQIAVAAEEQSVENVAKVIKESAVGASESAKARHDLSLLATELQSIVGDF